MPGAAASSTTEPVPLALDYPDRAIYPMVRTVTVIPRDQGRRAGPPVMSPRPRSLTTAKGLPWNGADGLAGRVLTHRGAMERTGRLGRSARSRRQ